MDTLKIEKVDKGTDLADKLICFVENFSWKDVKEHMLGEQIGRASCRERVY